MSNKKILFIPGYFGSTLVERKSRKLRWVRISDFFTNKYDLCMTESYTDLPKKNDLVDDQILLKVKIIPKILEVESYEKTLKHLKKFCAEKNRELHTVTYDWRDDFHESIKKVYSKIKELTQNGEKIEIVAHSNGGVLISYILRYGEQDFINPSESWEGLKYIEKVSIVASPLHGAFSLFRHIKYGTPVLKNKKMMGSLDYTSFKSSYFFLPPPLHQRGYIEKKGNEYKMFDLFNFDYWKNHQWGPFIEEHQKELPVNDQKFKELLLRAKNFQKLLNSEVKNHPNQTIKIQVVQGLGRSTFFYPTFFSHDSIAEYHYPKKDRLNGDGVVANVSSEPLHWFNLFDLQFLSLKAEHLKIISDYKFQKHIHDFLCN